MSAKHRVQSLSALVRLYASKRVARSAAALSYFLTLSLFPFLICIHAAADLVHLDNEEFFAALTQFIPGNVVSIIQDYLTYVSSNQSQALLAAGLLVMTTSSSAGFRTLLHSIDDVYDRRSYTGLWGLIVSVICSIVFLFTMYSAALILFSGRWIFQFLETELSILPILIRWNWIRFVLLLLLLLGMVYLLYRFTAPRTRPRLPVAGSACFTAFSLAGVSILFSWFIGLSSRYSLVYGSLAAIIILMIWLYLCGIILLLGATINAHKRAARREYYQPSKKTASRTVRILREPLNGYRHIRSGKKQKDQHGKR